MGHGTSIDLTEMQGKCVFCGCTDLAETLIWPRWLDEIVSHEKYQRINGATGEPVPEEPVSLQTARTDLRAPLAQRPRLACAACNSGWISKLGEEVRQFLVPALTGGTVDLAPEQARVLAGWLCLLAINAAFCSRHCGISAGDRTFLRHTRRPPNNWSMFVAGLSEAGWSKACKHHPYRIEFAGNPLTTCSKKAPIYNSNTQLLSFGMGGLFFHIFTSPSLLLQSEFSEASKSQGLTQLWPLERRFGLLPPRHVSIPPALTLTDEQAWGVTDLFADLLQHRMPSPPSVVRTAAGSVSAVR